MSSTPFIFISYSQKDSGWLEEFKIHLKPYIADNEDGLKVWDDQQIAVGARWKEEIANALELATIAVLLVSPDFLASDFIKNNELPSLLKAAEKRLTIFWIPIRSSGYVKTAIAEYRAAHPPAKPIARMEPAERDDAWVAICNKLDEVLQRQRQQETSVSPPGQQEKQEAASANPPVTPEKPPNPPAQPAEEKVTKPVQIASPAQPDKGKVAKPVPDPDSSLQSEPPLKLTPFTFEFETVVEVKNVLGLLNKQVITKRQSKSSHQHLEDLSNGVILHMVSIPGGSFVMGAPSSEKKSSSAERPQHAVTVKPFLMGKYPVTQEQWRVVAQYPQVSRKLDLNPSYFTGDNLPVEDVYWHDAIEFCARLSRKTRREYRLPSEAEWEYACRAGTTTPFHFGETITPDLVNYNGNYPYGAAPKGQYRERTTPVGSFSPNPFGLHDMHGNVWEWCADHWDSNYDNAPTDGSAWITGGNSNLRLLRGGSWYAYSRNCRSASRDDFYPENRNNDFGFRVVCSSAWTL